MEKLAPLITAVIFLGLVIGTKKTYNHYRNRPSVYDIFWKHFAFFIKQAVNPYLDVLFTEENQHTLRTIRDITWEEMVYKIPELPANPSFDTEGVRQHHVGLEIKNITLNHVITDVAKSHPEVQYQLCIFFEKALPLINKMGKDTDDLVFLYSVDVVQKLFKNYANAETRAKFEKEMTCWLAEVPSLVEE